MTMLCLVANEQSSTKMEQEVEKKKTVCEPEKQWEGLEELLQEMCQIVTMHE